MNKPFILLGHGGHARVVLDVLQCLGCEIAGVLTPDLAPGGHWHGLPVLGDDAWLEGRQAKDYAYAIGIGMVPHRPDLRARLYARLRALELDVPPLIHPSAILARNVQVGEGAQIMAGVIVQPGAILGENVLLNTGARIDHDCRLDGHCHIAPGALLCGEVKVGEGAFIGAGATLIQGVTIGQGAQVAAGATVVRDIEAGIRHIPGRPPKPIGDEA